MLDTEWIIIIVAGVVCVVGALYCCVRAQRSTQMEEISYVSADTGEMVTVPVARDLAALLASDFGMDAYRPGHPTTGGPNAFSEAQFDRAVRSINLRRAALRQQERDAQRQRPGLHVPQDDSRRSVVRRASAVVAAATTTAAAEDRHRRQTIADVEAKATRDREDARRLSVVLGNLDANSNATVTRVFGGASTHVPMIRETPSTRGLGNLPVPKSDIFSLDAVQPVDTNGSVGRDPGVGIGAGAGAGARSVQNTVPIPVSRVRPGPQKRRPPTTGVSRSKPKPREGATRYTISKTSPKSLHADRGMLPFNLIRFADPALPDGVTLTDKQQRTVSELAGMIPDTGDVGFQRERHSKADARLAKLNQELAGQYAAWLAAAQKAHDKSLVKDDDALPAAAASSTDATFSSPSPARTAAYGPPKTGGYGSAISTRQVNLFGTPTTDPKRDESREPRLL